MKMGSPRQRPGASAETSSRPRRLRRTPPTPFPLTPGSGQTGCPWRPCILDSSDSSSRIAGRSNFFRRPFRPRPCPCFSPRDKRATLDVAPPISPFLRSGEAAAIIEALREAANRGTPCVNLQRFRVGAMNPIDWEKYTVTCDPFDIRAFRGVFKESEKLKETLDPKRLATARELGQD